MYSRHPDANSIFALATGFLDLHMKSAAGDGEVTQFSNYLLTLQFLSPINKQLQIFLNSTSQRDCYSKKSVMSSYYKKLFWKGLELGMIPDFLTRSKIKSGLQQILTEMNGDGNIEKHQEALNDFVEEIKTMPIAINQDNANEQHYEVPAELYVKFLGPYLKYSCGFWPEESTTLEDSETLMLEMYCQRAQLQDGKSSTGNV